MRVFLFDQINAAAAVEQLLHSERDISVRRVEAGTATAAMILTQLPSVTLVDAEVPGPTFLLTDDGTSLVVPTIILARDDSHARRAFDLGAVDYLVKPIAPARLRRALDRARQCMQLAAGRRYRRVIIVKVNDRNIPIHVGEIDSIHASGPYADIRSTGRRFTIRETLDSLEETLDPEEFLRVHRSAIVRMRSIASFRRLPGGDAQLTLLDGSELRGSRTRRDQLERWFCGHA